MKSHTTWVFPGDHVALVTDQTMVLVAGSAFPIHKPRTETLWRLLERGAPLGAVLDRITGGSLGDLPAFALARIEGEWVRVFVRGQLAVRVGDETVLPGPVSTWVEVLLPLADPIELLVDGVTSSEPSGFVVEGIQRAGGLVRTSDRADLDGHDAGSEDPQPADEVSHLAESEEGEIDGGDQIADLDEAAVAAVSAAAGEATSSEEPDFDSSLDTDLTLPSVESTFAAVPMSEPNPPTVEPVEAVLDAVGYDHLFGSTVRRTVEDAAVRPEESAPSSPDPDAVASAVVAESPGEEQTVRRGARSDPTILPSSLGSTNGPKVQAVTCPAGHANPAYADRCRVCGVAVAQADPVTVPRPMLGVLTFETGETVALARPVIMGRSPKATSSIGGEMPLLFTVRSPQSDVSRSHLEVRIDGWHVLVVDLDSANGTTVTIPGHAPRRLHPGEPVTIPVGSQVTMADEVTFRYEAVD